MWEAIASAPNDLDLELAIIDNDEHHALIFPCRRGLAGWTNVHTGQRVAVEPSHWRLWSEA